MCLKENVFNREMFYSAFNKKGIEKGVWLN